MPSSIRTRLLAAFLAVAFAAAVGLSLYFFTELESFGLRKLEERLDTQSRLVAAIVGTSWEAAGGFESAGTEASVETVDEALRRVSPDVATRLRILDAGGTALADSGGAEGRGASYGDRPEVRAALAGDYGANTRVTPDGRVALYVAEPIVVDGVVVGAAYSSATTFSIRTLLRDYRERLVVLVLAFIALAVIVAELLARWLSKPLAELASGAAAFAVGDHAVRVRPSGARETREVADAFNELASEIEALVAELREEEERKSRFVSDVSHELRTPLTAIRGAAETLIDGDVPPEDQRRFLLTVAAESERLARLANDLLTLQRIEGGTGELPFRPIELAEVVRRAADAIAPLADERGVRLEVRGDRGAVLGDPDRLLQVAANLLDNAVRVTPSGGLVEVELGEDGASAVISIADRGPGIPEADVPHIFERFYRSQPSRDRSTGGAGLGLAIVKAIVDAHVGGIEVTGRPGGGSTFTVRLPLLPE